jgi:hypothetical protein
MNDQKNDVVESKENEENDEMTSSQNDVNENRASNSSLSSESSFSEFFSSEEKEIVSFATFQRCVVFESIFDSESSFDLWRSSRRSSQTSFKKKTIDFQRKRKRRIVAQTSSSLKILTNFLCFVCMIKLNNDYVFFSRIMKSFYLTFRFFFVRSSNSWSRSNAFMFFFVTHSLYFFDQSFHLIR